MAQGELEPKALARRAGLDLVEALYQDRRRRALDLRAEGRKVVGYLCCYPPVEMLTALDLVPFRIQGDVDRPIGEADAYLETVSCSFIRNCFDLALAGHYDFLDGLIVPHSCDTVQRIYDIWRYFRPPQLMHLLNIPHLDQPSSYVFFKHELSHLRRALEAFAGRALTTGALREAIALHNENRALLRQLYALRKSDPPPIRGSEVMKVIVAGMGMPVAEYNDLLRAVISEVGARGAGGQKGRPRLLVYGAELDDAGFFQLLEEAGADVVVDDICVGTRSFWPDVPLTDDPLDGLASRYLGEIRCPRTYRAQVLPRAADLENRFAYLKDFARDFRVDGIVFYIMRFCDTHELDAVDVAQYFAAQEMPVLHLEEEYRIGNVGQIRTRAEAFLETIGG